jgi:hypothetical protein
LRSATLEAGWRGQECNVESGLTDIAQGLRMAVVNAAGREASFARLNADHQKPVAGGVIARR